MFIFQNACTFPKSLTQNTEICKLVNLSACCLQDGEEKPDRTVAKRNNLKVRARHRDGCCNVFFLRIFLTTRFLFSFLLLLLLKV